MKIIEALNKIDALKPNVYKKEDKIEWLSILDGIVKQEVIDTHESDTEITFNGYNVNTPLETELLVGAPYDDIYIAWLESKIDYSNGEYGKYNNSITRFNDIYANYFKSYNRKNMPIGTKVKYF